jgi:anaerobic sulfite reductase subunit B
MAAIADGHGLAPRPVPVLSRRQETHDTWTLRLPAGAAFAPGQFAMLYAFGAGEAPISVSGVDGDVEHTVRAVGAVTRALCRADVLGVRGPFGNCWPLDAAAGRDVVVIAGGIGLAPLRPVIRALAGREAVHVLYGARGPAEMLYTDELERWGAQVIVDVPDATWPGAVGVVTKLIERAAFDPARALAMICGPEVMMRFAVGALRARGVPADAIWVSLERSMHCGTGHCGHCQLGPRLICRDGPVFRHDAVERLLRVPEL